MTTHIYTGFGFGPIQAGLFVKEAYQSNHFERIVIAEVDPILVQALRQHQGRYSINVAHADGIQAIDIQHIQILNPADPDDRPQLLDALAASTEINTSLPSVAFFNRGGDNSAASLIAQGLQRSSAPATILYAAENHNHAAEILHENLNARLPQTFKHPYQCLNTVIGKMSRVVTDPHEIAQLKLKPITPSLDRAFLVEAFNRILVSRCTLPDFKPGIEVFAQKDDLLPFEHAKLFGHNATHALLAYIGQYKGYARMTDLANDPALMAIGRNAFLNESGAALCKKYETLNDPLFTPAGYNEFAQDLLQRMLNPYLVDTIERAARDPLRKLAANDRLFGTMQLALQQGIQPSNYATGALAGCIALFKNPDQYHLPAALHIPDPTHPSDQAIADLLLHLWQEHPPQNPQHLIQLTQQARPTLDNL